MSNASRLLDALDERLTGAADLFLTKLMRDDPIDRADAEFIVKRAGLTREQISTAIRDARIPPIPEIQEQFEICSVRYLNAG